MKKKIGLMLISTMFLSTLVVPVHALKYTNFSQNNYNKIQLIDDMMEDEKFLADFKATMIEQYGEDYQIKLKNNELAVKNANIIESKFSKDKLGETVYPDYIGGLYIDDNDNLVIKVVKQNIPNSKNAKYKNYESIMNVDENAIIEYADYSYEELNEVYDIILNNYLGKIDNLTGLYVDVISNRVVVELKELTDNKIDEFINNVIDSPMISFDNATTYNDISNINPGEKITTQFGNTCSYGYRAKMTSGISEISGIVTAGHCFDNIGNSISGVGQVIKYSDSGALDAAFIATDSNINPTNLINGSTTLSTTVNSSPVVGQTISKYGYVTKLTSGVIKSINYSYTDTSDWVTHTNLIRTTMSANNGDSGGIVFQPSATGVTANATVGIMAAKSSSGTESLVTKASVINSTFGLSRY